MPTKNGAVLHSATNGQDNGHHSRYDPLSSVWEGSDGELLERMLCFYPSIPPEPILDATYNAGRFWVGSNRNVWSMDIDPQYNTKLVADNRTMVGLNRSTGNPAFRVPSNTFGTVVFDPPHVGPQGRDKSVKRFDVDFGATIACGKEHNWTLSYLYPPFLEQAKRVLKPDGILFAKITESYCQILCSEFCQAASWRSPSWKVFPSRRGMIRAWPFRRRQRF